MKIGNNGAILFSVLLSVYYKESSLFLQQALNSIIDQTLPPSEIVIVKDGVLSNDLNNVIENFLNKYPNLFHIVDLPVNKGLGLALREGVLKCKYPYIARMDTDDIADKNRFLKQVNFLQKNPDIDLLGTWISEFSENIQKVNTITKLPLNDYEIRAFAKKRNPFRHMTMFLRKESVINSGNYRHFLYFEDYDLWVRMLQNGYKGANLPEVLVNVRTEDDFYKRRGGISYIKQEYHFQLFLYKTNFINIGAVLSNLIIRTTIRIMPLNIKKWLYTKWLRNEPSYEK